MGSLKSTQNLQSNRETTKVRQRSEALKFGAQAQIRSEALLKFETRLKSRSTTTQIRNEAKVAIFETLGKPKA